MVKEDSLERRARRRLAKYGLKVRYHRNNNDGYYTVFVDPNLEGVSLILSDDEEIQFDDIYKLLEFTEYLRERYEIA